jgi:hypothetical protein
MVTAVIRRCSQDAVEVEDNDLKWFENIYQVQFQ